MTDGAKQTQTTVLVTAASGKTGRRVAARLADRGVRVRAGSRIGDVPFDWAAESTWGPALRGAEAAYVAYHPDLAGPGAVDAMGDFGRLAAASGLDRLVLLSGRGEPEAARAEDALRAAAPGVPLTVVRAAFLAQNFSEGAFFPDVVAGAVPFPAGTTAEPFLDVDDLADVVVTLLTEGDHEGRTYELTGPRLLTFDEVAAELSGATGRTVRYLPVSGEQYEGLLVGAGVPAADARWLAGLFTALMDGRNASVTDGVRSLPGRAPRDFTAFVKDAAAAGAWSGRPL